MALGTGVGKGEDFVVDRFAENVDGSDVIHHYDSGYYRPGYGGRTRNSREFNRMAAYWKYALFERMGIPTAARMLDFGAGLGLISARLPNCICYDVSDYARDELRRSGRRVVDCLDELSVGEFDVVLLSHVLEHVLRPAETLGRLGSLLRKDGLMLVVLPVETNTRLMFGGVDDNNHLYCWTPQTIGNLAAACHLTIHLQCFLYGPFGLRVLCDAFRLKLDRAAHLSYLLGQYKRNRMSKSILTVMTRPESTMPAHGEVGGSE
jgi:SAM-dependent methyltransferase